VLQTFSNHSESQSLYLRDRGLMALAISQDARQLQDLRQPAAVLFLLYLDLEGNHALGSSPPRSYGSAPGSRLARIQLTF
jgi:hypothetical protein